MRSALLLPRDGDEPEVDRRIVLDEMATEDTARGLDLQMSLILALGAQGMKQAARTNTLPTAGLQQSVQASLERGFIGGARVGSDQLATAGIEVSRYAAMGISASWMEEALRSQLGLINGNTSRKILDLIAKMEENEYSFDWLEWKLENLFGKSRAEGIGVTVTTLAYVVGAVMTYKVSSLVDLIQFFTARDERVCRICRPLHLRIYPLTGHPILGLSPFHTKCRCYPAPVIDRVLKR